MKCKHGVVLLLLSLVGSPLQSSGQQTAAERKEIDALKAKADKGDPDAEINLATHYAEGTGVARDPGKSVRLLRKAAEQGNARAQCLAQEFEPRKALGKGKSPSPPANVAPGPAGQTNAAGTASTPPKTGVVNRSAVDDSYEIFVDAASVGNTTTKVRLTEGTHIVEVKKAGFKDFRREIKITERSELTLRSVLEKPSSWAPQQG
jgi:TPR repeat protein